MTSKMGEIPTDLTPQRHGTRGRLFHIAVRVHDNGEEHVHQQQRDEDAEYAKPSCCQLAAGFSHGIEVHVTKQQEEAEDEASWNGGQFFHLTSE
mmetsp:Transcript_133205/g.249098  ORF Transcript_133205/g.249098 Transcript_133205/m.249098 type:complete len:94 (+) Transcript_133205:1330-1611(+)